MISAKVTIQIKDLEKFSRSIQAQLKHKKRGPVHDAIIQWGVRYRAYTQRRYRVYSRGGTDGTGDSWPPLKRKRKRGSKQSASVLIDTGTMFAALAPVFNVAPGAYQKEIPFGLIVGFGGSARHSKGGRATIADIASFHQFGKGRLPKREIIVYPPEKVTKLMASDMKRALDRLEEL